MNKDQIRLFWERVKELNRRKGITMKSLLSLCYENTRSAEAWVNRNTLPTIDAFLKMSMVLDVDPYYLLWGDSPPVKEDLVLASRISKKLEEEGTPDLESRLKKIEEELAVIRKGEKQ